MTISKFPHLYQRGKTDCGITCIEILIKYYNITKKVKRNIATEKTLSIFEVTKILSSLDLNAKAIQVMEIEGLNKISFPFITLINDCHYVVVYDKTNEDYYVSDPKKGKIRIRKNKFEYYFLNNEEKIGKVITVAQQNFNKNNISVKMEKKYVSFLLKTFKEFTPFFSHIGLLMFILTFLQAITPFFFRVIIDLGVNKNNLSFINVIISANFVLIIGIGIGTLIKERFLEQITEKFKGEIFKNYLMKILSSDTFLSSQKVGHILSKLKDLEILNSFLTNKVIYFINSCLTTIIYLVILFVFDHTIFIIFLISLIIYISWQFAFVSYFSLIERDVKSLQIKDKNYWSDVINNVFDIKLSNSESKSVSQWTANNEDLNKVSSKEVRIKSIQELGNSVINGTKSLIILYFSVTQVLDGKMSFGTLISIQFIVGFLNAPLFHIISFFSNMSNYKNSLRNLELEHRDLLLDKNNGEVKIKSIEQIKLFNTTILYPESNHSSLSNINLSIFSGKKYAFVGKSGSGKSTLLKALLGLSKVSYGKIEVDNISLHSLDLGVYRNNFSCIIQESNLIEGSFVENITYSSQNVNFEWLNEVVRLTNLDDIISLYPNGIFSIISNFSKGISEGQKQRILLARAIYLNRPYLIMDEGTSALDSYNEYIIFENIKKLYKEKTMLIATHNLNLIKDFDVIFVLNKGELVEYGNHEELMNRRGYYSVLFNVQNKK